jgi:redox-sensitive bicupin YhaK (pirin superfamily)
MAQSRGIHTVYKSKPVIEGAGVHLKRAFGFGETSLFDPFLLLDDFRSDVRAHYIKGFPWHPHRGIETITYVLSGDVAHGDSLGNQGIITSGDVQWMTAGSGIIHQEMPQGDADGKMAGFQLWANLPAKHKMMNPRYRDITTDQIPVVRLDSGIEIRIICGQIGATQGPAQDIVIDPQYLDVTVPPHTTYTHPTRPGHTVLAYAIDGKGFFCDGKETFNCRAETDHDLDMPSGAAITNEMLVLFEDGDQVFVGTGEAAFRFLLISGKPLNEPVAWRGPIVMNTQEELQAAFAELEQGTFVKQGRAR